MTKDFHLTKEGVAELKSELEKLKLRRLEVAEDLKTAKEQGDLSENSDWESAQDEQKYVEGRIHEIERILRNVEIISHPGSSKQIQLGSKVTMDCNGSQLVYTLVGSIESNPIEGKISNESPIGKALLGKKVGDQFEVPTPNSGSMTCKVVKIN